MSLLNSKINSVEAEVLNLGEAKANTLFPTFQGTATFAGPVVLRDVVSFGSSSITGLTKTAVGLDQVNNTSDAAKPISTLQQAQFDLKATKLNPSFSGNATFAGPVAFNNSNITGLTKATVGLDKVQNIDAAAYTDQQIQSLVSGAPAMLDTLSELANAINKDPNYSMTITSLISTKANKSDVDNQLANYLTTAAASTTYQTALKVATGNTQPNQFKLLNTRPGFPGQQYITTFNFPNNSLYSVSYSNSTPDVLSWDDSNFYSTFYTQSQINSNFQTIVGMSNYYTKAETDNNYYTIGYLANNYYTRTDILNLLKGYFTAAQITSSYYTKTDSDNNYYNKTFINTNYYTKTDSDNNYYNKTFINTNYYTKTDIDNNYQSISGMSNYFTKTAIVNNYYDKATVNNYIDAKIDASYVLEMLYNEGGHNHLVAVDPTTNTTYLDVINKQTNETIAKFDVYGPKFYAGSTYAVSFLNITNSNAIATFSPTTINHYVQISMYNSLTIYKSDRSSATAVFGDANISLNIPLLCNNYLNLVNNRLSGTIQVSPTSDGYETSIGFYRNTNKSINNTGDLWMVGSGFESQPGTFGIYSQGYRLKIDTTGVVTIPTGLVVNSTNIINNFKNYYPKTEVDSKLTGYYTKAQVESKLPTSIVYKANDVNYIVAGDSTQNQLQFLYDGVDIMDLDAGALTVNTNVIATNVAQYYTINSGGIAQWFNLGTLNTTQEGKHFVIRISYANGYDGSSSAKNNSATVHFKTSNGHPPNAIGHNGAAFYGDLIVYSYGPDRSIKARATQLNSTGTSYLMSIYLPAFSGDALIEFVGAFGVTNQSFNYNPVPGQTWGNDNYIEGVSDFMFSTSNPPTLSDISGGQVFSLTITAYILLVYPLLGNL